MSESACDRESSEEDYYAKEVQRIDMLPPRTDTSESCLVYICIWCMVALYTCVYCIYRMDILYTDGIFVYTTYNCIYACHGMTFKKSNFNQGNTVKYAISVMMRTKY